MAAKACTVLLLVALAHATELLKYDPTPNPAAVVVVGNVRFTVLTSQLIRMELSSSGSFEDRRTVAIVNRNLPAPAFSHDITAGVLTIKTDNVTLTYPTAGPFSQIKVVGSSPGAFQSWYPGQPDLGNLFGTIRTLDGIGVNDLNCTLFTQETGRPEWQSHCASGLISRNGWAVVNDTANPVLDSADWWTPDTNSNVVDLYLFAHGHDYKQAILDFTKIAGKIAMVPRYMSGVFWTRWFDINNYDMRKIVEDYASRSIPLDVFILDMDWHTKNDWTGYTFDKRLFPIPADSMAWLKNKGLAIAANIHDASGVNNWEDMYDAMARAVGRDPSTGARIDFAPLNQTYMYALEDIVMQHLIETGMDFWWIDWQQGERYAGCAGGAQNPTITTNMVRGTDHLRRGEPERDVILARFGGLGSHRYQVGFSGDVAALSWANLAFQPYFSSTASNVAFGFWSHDIEGPSQDIEMFVRWVQWGAFSGAFRSHERGMSAGSCADDSPPTCSIVEVYDVPKYPFEYNRAALQWRERLVPYIYTRVREAFDSGLGLTRPMYYDYPEYDGAYWTNKEGDFAQYMFGPDLLVAPVVTPANTTTNLADKAIWLPPGAWIEHETGLVYNSAGAGTVIQRQYDLSEIPVFVKAGAIIPSIPVVTGDTLGLAMRQYTTLEFSVFAGDQTRGTTQVYEDDGATTAYLNGSYAYTTASYVYSGGSFLFTVSSQGSYPTFPATRTVILRLINAMPPVVVTANGLPIYYSRYGGTQSVTYDGDSMAVVIQVNNVATNQPLRVIVEQLSLYPALVGVKGAMRHAILAKNNLNQDRSTKGENSPNGGYLQMAASQGDAFAYLAGTNLTAFKQAVDGYAALYQLAIAEVKGLRHPSPDQGALVQLFDDARSDHCLCGTDDCVNSNNYYDFLRVEGWMPAATHPHAIKLNMYWDADRTDNWATTQLATPPSYSPADFANGYVLSAPESGTAPLQLYWSDALKHHYTVATTDGIADAQRLGFRLLNSTLGYVYTNKPGELAGAVGEPPAWRWDYSMALMYSALPAN